MSSVEDLASGWLELESDPGLFTLLLEAMGVSGVAVEEVYDVSSELSVPNDTLGFIFLFKWIEERRSRRKIIDEQENLYVKDDATVNSIFFAHQIVPNSCATHALVSILLNCAPSSSLRLGSTLDQLKSHVCNMGPENKGLAIGNCPQLAQAHNSHAAPRASREQLRQRSEQRPSSSGVVLPTSGSRYVSSAASETFHFVSYVPINGRLYELDGLKRYPIDHGPVMDPWTSTFRSVITSRLAMASGGEDIRFALMAVVPDRRPALINDIKYLKANKNIILKNLEERVKGVPLDASSVEDEEVVVVDAFERRLKRLERQVNKLLELRHSKAINKVARKTNTDEDRRATQKILKRRISSRASSFDSSVAPESPFQSNPLLVSHDYSKSPMMLTDDDDHEDNAQDEQDPATRHLGEGEHSQETADTSNLSSFDARHNRLTDVRSYSSKALFDLLRGVHSDCIKSESQLREENEKRKKYKVDDCRRVHNYDPFIKTFLSMLAEQGLLADLLEYGLNPTKKTNGKGSGKNGKKVKGGSSKAFSSSKKKAAAAVYKGRGRKRK